MLLALLQAQNTPHLDLNQISFLANVFAILAALGTMFRILWVTEERVKSLTQQLADLKKEWDAFEARQEARDTAFRTEVAGLSRAAAFQEGLNQRPPGPK